MLAKLSDAMTDLWKATCALARSPVPSLTMANKVVLSASVHWGARSDIPRMIKRLASPMHRARLSSGCSGLPSHNRVRSSHGVFIPRNIALNGFAMKIHPSLPQASDVECICSNCIALCQLPSMTMTSDKPAKLLHNSRICLHL